ncbi:MAG: dTDP-4-dehydrorhamnose reductase, partial [Gallionellaceae bacterium]|nr:dTDP-4-dehydrorhamnose reductase [Gallionellaceae bacterium]
AEVEPELAMAVNGIAPGVLAEEAKKLSALLIHYSTDYVFDGNKVGAYTEDDATNPLGVYGKTKLAGEQAIRATGCNHLIFRTSWVYGARGKNFLLTMLRLARERDELRVVDDQIGSPTWSRSLAEVTGQILAQLNKQKNNNSIKSDTYNLTSAASVSWHGFTAEILRLAALHPKLIPIPSRDYPTPATRPMNSVMSNDKLVRDFGLSVGSWQDSLQLCMQENAVVSYLSLADS